MRTLLLLLLLLFCNCCHQIASRGVSGGYKYTASLPGDWPLPHVLFDQGMSIAAAPNRGFPMGNAAKGSDERMWMLYIKCPGGEAALASYLYDRLKADGYSQYFMVDRHGNEVPPGLGQTYYSADGTLSIGYMPDISGGTMPQQMLHPKKNYQPPQQPVTSSDYFQVFVNSGSSPLEEFTHIQSLESKGMARLKPLQ